MKTINVKDKIWRKLVILKTKYDLGTINEVIEKTLTLIKVRKMEDELK